ncbi:MAG TPA: PaaI family thioesterase, partial [Burkholderiaceae bacterium]|nr:PaaI family thioesterase [Burkholderiaceae bacterium]
LADHTAGAAGVSLLAAGDFVVTAEFKLNLLRPATGEYLWCRAQVLKPGKTLIVVESEIFAVNGDSRVLVSKLNATLAVVQQKLSS